VSGQGANQVGSAEERPDRRAGSRDVEFLDEAAGTSRKASETSTATIMPIMSMSLVAMLCLSVQTASLSLTPDERHDLLLCWWVISALDVASGRPMRETIRLGRERSHP
jgi:hypothetical protein